MSNLGIDILLGDEMRAAETVGNVLTGRPVSASSVADAAITVGSDLLMFVPGLGAAAAAAKAGRVAKAATRGARALSRAQRVTTEAKRMKGNRIAAQRHPNMKQASAMDRKVESNLYQVAAKETRKAGRYAQKAGIQDKPTATKFAKAKQDAQLRRTAMKKKRNSPRRKKMRYTGHVVSDTANIQQIAAAYDEEQ